VHRLSVPLALLLVACRAPLARYAYEEPAMGTTFRILLYAPDEAAGAAAAADAFARIRALEAVFSDYDAASEARALAARGPGTYAASRELVELTALALEVGERSGGAFDVTVGPLTRLWRRAVRQGEVPDPERLAAARAAVGADKLAVDRAAGTLTLRAAGMRLDYGGIAKGYALDEALRALARRGIERALVDGGGDVACGAAPPGAAGWLVALDEPAELDRPARAVLLAHGALATSGDRARGGDVGGVARSHLIDPRTGAALDARPRRASAVAASGALADAAASTLLVLDGAEGMRFAASLVGVETRLVELGPGGRAGGWTVWATAGFPPLVSSATREHAPLEFSP
jgi:thiamine biosynthesis lipoprotein